MYVAEQIIADYIDAEQRSDWDRYEQIRRDTDSDDGAECEFFCVEDDGEKLGVKWYPANSFDRIQLYEYNQSILADAGLAPDVLKETTAFHNGYYYLTEVVPCARGDDSESRSVARRELEKIIPRPRWGSTPQYHDDMDNWNQWLEEFWHKTDYYKAELVLWNRLREFVLDGRIEGISDFAGRNCGWKNGDLVLIDMGCTFIDPVEDPDCV